MRSDHSPPSRTPPGAAGGGALLRSDGRLRWSVEVGAPTHGDALEHHRCATGPACSAARTVVKVSFITILSSAPTSVAPESRARSPESCARGAPVHAGAPAAAGGQPGSRPCSELLRPLRGAGGGRPGARGSYRSVVRWLAKLDAPPPPAGGRGLSPTPRPGSARSASPGRPYGLRAGSRAMGVVSGWSGAIPSSRGSRAGTCIAGPWGWCAL